MAPQTHKYKTPWIFLAFFPLLLLATCASLKHFRTSREVQLDKVPYFKSFSKIIPAMGRVGHLPIILDMRAGDPFEQRECQTLLGEMNKFIRDQHWTHALEGIGLPIEEAPDLFIGCPDMFGAPVSASHEEGRDEVLRMVLYFKNASTIWNAQLAKVCREGNVDYALVIMLGYSSYAVRQKNLLGQKELPLGTGYKDPVKWLTSLDDPVEVLHLTGALVDTTGKIHRVSAEGIIAARTASLLESALNLQNVISAETIKSVGTDKRREDLAGAPLAYQVALQNLVAQLLGRQDLMLQN